MRSLMRVPMRAAVLVLMVAACGGGSDGGSSSTPTTPTTPPAPAKVATVEVTPGSASLVVGGTQQLTAVANY